MFLLFTFYLSFYFKLVDVNIVILASVHKIQTINISKVKTRCLSQHHPYQCLRGKCVQPEQTTKLIVGNYNLQHDVEKSYLWYRELTWLALTFMTRRCAVMKTAVQSLAAGFITSKQGRVRALYSLLGFAAGTRPCDKQLARWAGSWMTLQRTVMRTFSWTHPATCVPATVRRHVLAELWVFGFT